MRRCAIRSGALVVLGLAIGLVSSSARAESRFSLELGGVWSHSPVDLPGGDDVRQRAAAGTDTGGGAGRSALQQPSDSIVGFELRPNFVIGRGLRVGVGFRAGSTGGVMGMMGGGGSSHHKCGCGGGAVGGYEASVVGGDVSIGWARLFGRLMPFVEGRFGFNRYDLLFGDGSGGRMLPVLRLDAVVGARMYLGGPIYVVASAFAGWGDRYGASVALGFDMVTLRQRGLLP